jgi:murein DD-endopeptidase MepM/ murein hydrolase activator NlpD
LSRRTALALAASVAATGAQAQSPVVNPLRLSGRLQQGGHAVGRINGRGAVFVDGAFVGPTSPRGVFVVGFDRDEPATRLVRVESDRGVLQQVVTVAPSTFVEQRVDGLPPSTVTPTDPRDLVKIAQDTAKKQAAFKSREDADWFQGGFLWPLEKFRVSSQWGNRRILNGEPRTPHYGIDLAAPKGASIKAPAPGRVVLADPDMHFEGGLVLLDHGQGLISMYLHMDSIDVRAGEIAWRGTKLGEVGMKGRATGPHLCWRLKWRDRNCDPSLWVAA